MSDLRKMFADALKMEGAAVEEIEPEGLEIVLPAHVGRALAMPEWCRLGFGRNLPEDAQAVGFESDYVERLGELLGERGATLALDLTSLFSLDRAPVGGRVLEKHLSFENAVYRGGTTEDTFSRYTLLIFHLTAVSDEKREEILRICFNETAFRQHDLLADSVLALLPSLSNDVMVIAEGYPSPLSDGEVWKFMAGVLPARIKDTLAPFVGGMQRRLKRDLEQIHGYYSDLRREAALRLEEKAKKNGDLADLKREELRVESVDREFHAKAADVHRRYALTATVEVSQVLRFVLPVRRFHFEIRRRKGVRETSLDWNPLSKKLDPLCCDACCLAVKSALVCDDQLHVLCKLCMPECVNCRKSYCVACHPQGCPKCG